MAKFCEDCPSKGECVGEIEGSVMFSCQTTGNISSDGRRASISFEGGIPQGPTVMTVKYIDEAGRASEPITLSGATFEAAESQVSERVDAIDGCHGPLMTKRWLGFISSQQCGAEQAHS